MKSSDYFSNFYGSSVNSNISQEQYNKQRKESIRNEKCANVENMLNWLYCETEHAFNNIPEAELRKLVPSNIEFKFIHDKYGYYIHVVLYKYRSQSDLFGDTLYDSAEHKMRFYNFEAMPKIYRDNLKEVKTSLTAGVFYAYGLPAPDYITPVKPYIGKYKAVYEICQYNDSTDCQAFSYYIRE
jgi:hypothetical protein